MLVLEGLTKAFGETRAVQGVDLTIPAGQFVGVIGRSGAGKSYMDEAREVIGRMVETEDRTQTELRARLEGAARWLKVGLIGSGIMYLALAVFAATNSYRQMAKLVASRDELRATHRRVARGGAGGRQSDHGRHRRHNRRRRRPLSARSASGRGGDGEGIGSDRR